MYLTTRALVLRVTDYNDRDSLLTLLTPHNGKITAKARGLRRKNSPLTAPCQLLAYGDFVLFDNRGFYTINEAASVELFKELGTIEATWHMTIDELGPFVVGMDCKGNNLYKNHEQEVDEAREKALAALGIEPDFEFTKLY